MLFQTYMVQVLISFFRIKIPYLQYSASPIIFVGYMVLVFIYGLIVESAHAKRDTMMAGLCHFFFSSQNNAMGKDATQKDEIIGHAKRQNNEKTLHEKTSSDISTRIDEMVQTSHHKTHVFTFLQCLR